MAIHFITLNMKILIIDDEEAFATMKVHIEPKTPFSEISKSVQNYLSKAYHHPDRKFMRMVYNDLTIYENDTCESLGIPTLSTITCFLKGEDILLSKAVYENIEMLKVD